MNRRTRRALTGSVGPFAGPGLFTGKPASVRVHPSDGSSAGLRLRKPGAGTTPISPALINPDTAWSGLPAHVPIHNTTLRTPSGSIFATLEHLLAALAGLGVWDAIIELDGDETPILDGSSVDFARAIAQASRADDRSSIPTITLLEPVHVEDQRGGAITAFPIGTDQHAGYAYSLDYGAKAPAVLRGEARWVPDADEPDFLTAVAPARTFNIEADALAARRAGLFAHLSFRDALVFAADGQPIENTLRFSDEPCRHKLLDLIGDLAVLGRPLHARVQARRSGHALTHELCRRIMLQRGR